MNPETNKNIIEKEYERNKEKLDDFILALLKDGSWHWDREFFTSNPPIQADRVLMTNIINYALNKLLLDKVILFKNRQYKLIGKAV